MNVYVTEQGDMWDLISYKVYGDEKYQSELLKENPEHLKTIVFEAGILIFCPVIERPYSYNLPPWKRG